MSLDSILEDFRPGVKILTEDYTTTVNGKEYFVPKGFAFNGVSIPTPLLFIVDGDRFGPTFVRPSLLHDHFYDQSYTGEVGRKEGDDIFFDCLREDGNTKIMSGSMWAVVRLFGLTGYKKENWYFPDYEKVKRNITIEDYKETANNIQANDVYFWIFMAIFIGLVLAFLLFYII
jgi:hypothetical protein